MAPPSGKRARQRPYGALRSALLAAVLLMLGVVAGWWLASELRPAPPKPTSVPRAVRTPPYIPPNRPVRSSTPAPVLPVVPAVRVAIVFDDAGGALAEVEDIIAIGRPVTVAVLPGLRYSAEIAQRAQAEGLEVILHLPLEPLDGTKALGPGGVRVTMGEAEIQAAVRAGLASVPGASGVSNHMGSRATADRRVMRAVMVVARERSLFFLDSRTTPHSVAGAVATEAGVRSAARTVFLDNENDPAAIRREIRHLIETALRHGEAVAIAHAQRLTPRLVAEMLPEFDRAGIALVPISALTR